MSQRLNDAKRRLEVNLGKIGLGKNKKKDFSADETPGNYNVLLSDSTKF